MVSRHEGEVATGACPNGTAEFRSVPDRVAGAASALAVRISVVVRARVRGNGDGKLCAIARPAELRGAGHALSGIRVRRHDAVAGVPRRAERYADPALGQSRGRHATEYSA